MPGSGDARASGGSPARAPASSRDVWFDAEDSSGTRRGDSARAHLNSADFEDVDASDAEVAATVPRPTVARWALADVPTGRDSPGSCTAAATRTRTRACAPAWAAPSEARAPSARASTTSTLDPFARAARFP